MDAADVLYLYKAQESLAGAESEFANGRYNNCANRCYYACFHGAVYALLRSGIAPAQTQRGWGHSFVQAQFVEQLINRRKLHPPTLRDVLARNIVLRQTADYRDDHVTQTQALRALRRSREFVATVQTREGTAL